MSHSICAVVVLLVICGSTEAVWSVWANTGWYMIPEKEAHCPDGQKVLEMNWSYQEWNGLIDVLFKCGGGDDEGSTYRVTHNDNGSWGENSVCSSGFDFLMTREQSGNGVVNARTKCDGINLSDGTNYDGRWGRVLRCTGGKQITGFGVKAQSGYGIMNVRISCN